MIFDTHAHYDSEQFDGDREAVLAALKEGGVGRVVNIAADIPSVETTFALARTYDQVYGVLGIHPDGVPDMGEGTVERIRALVREDGGRKIVAVGEIGLDYYHRDHIPRELQKKWFVRQLELSEELGLPVVIHSREAAQDTYEILKACRTGDGCGIMHCYSYSREMAARFLDLGYYIALGGVVTFKNARAAKEVAAYVPEDRLLLETDCPYMAPVPYRGTRNDSRLLREVVKAVAALRGVSEAEVEEMTWRNANRLYRIPD
ncbi:MAG: TatD family hydrolase [Lachnospiraceae bacterium]|nr:TatD family hydrolase [Lachnospiraceae bacterium]